MLGQPNKLHLTFLSFRTLLGFCNTLYSVAQPLSTSTHCHFLSFFVPFSWAFSSSFEVGCCSSSHRSSRVLPELAWGKFLLAGEKKILILRVTQLSFCCLLSSLACNNIFVRGDSVTSTLIFLCPHGKLCRVKGFLPQQGLIEYEKKKSYEEKSGFSSRY